jgi:dienelactone hydrolase
MSTSFATPESLPAIDAEAPLALRRSAFYLDSQGEGVFAWLHHCSDRPCFDHGVILCPPIGCEQLHAHRALRHLADAIAREKIPVLRPDYHGTGDSAGADEDPNRYATWLANLRDAIAWMRRELKCMRISLIGLRLGALLATTIAGDEEIDNLVLWVPVAKGRTYVREMKALSLTADASLRGLDDGSGDIEAAGFVLSKQTADDLSQVDLLRSTPRCKNALIVARDDAVVDTKLLDHLAALGIAAEQSAQPGYVDMMAEPHDTQVPVRAIRHITDWLAGKVAQQSKATAVLNFDTIHPATVAVLRGAGVTADEQPTTRERLLRISMRPDLFAILAEPEQPRPQAEKLPLIILLNAGCSYRIGPGRMHVLLARQLAAAGFRTLRLDLCGLGDSVASEAEAENDPYSPTAFRDIDLAIKFAQQHLGTTEVVITGLCSGAYAAFQSAAQFTSPALVESILINPLTYFWKEGMVLDTSTTRQLISWHFYLTSVLKPRKWYGLLFGKSHLGVRGAIRRLAKWPPLPNSARHAAARYSLRTEYSHPEVEDLPGDLNRVASAGRKLALFCSSTDPGHFILMFHARRKANQLRRSGCLQVFFVNDADHTFSTRRARHDLSEAILAHLQGRYTAR